MQGDRAHCKVGMQLLTGNSSLSCAIIDVHTEVLPARVLTGYEQLAFAATCAA